jgi:hypothetical protein
MRQLLINIGLFSLFAISIQAREYFGVKLGSLRNVTFGLHGDVYLVNETTLQVTNFNLKKSEIKLDLSFYFSTADEVSKATKIYKVLQSDTGEYAKQLNVTSLDGGFDGDRLIISIPGNYKQWTYFGVVAEEKWFYLSAVGVNNKQAPEPFCCITDETQPNRGIAGFFYSSGSGPITVLDAKTLLLPRFTFEGTKPPDGWIYAGRGRVDKTSGRKALVMGRDSKALHCPLREDYTGNVDLRVQLADNQTIYDINYLSVYCFAVGVDFGHVNFNLSPVHNPVPPSMPPIRDTPPPVSTIPGEDGRTEC